MKAAEKVKASGLPAHAVRDKLLRAVVEDGSMEDDEEMQERWATLLANAATDKDEIRLAYPRILAELEPKEALLLERLWEKTPNPAEEPSRRLPLRPRATSLTWPGSTTSNALGF